MCALAHAHLGDDVEARRLEQEAAAHGMSGYGTVLDARRLHLDLHRNNLETVESLIEFIQDFWTD